MAPFYGCLNAIEPLQGHSLLFTTKCPGVPDTHFINPGSMKGYLRVYLKATQWF